MDKIEKLLFDNADEKYRNFHSSLIPTVDKQTIIGVRVPTVRKIAKYLQRNCPQDVVAFLSELPHKYYDENVLHAVLISDISDYDKALAYTEKFLPFIDNWAVCDIFNPRAFKNHENVLWQKIEMWLYSNRTYTVRFAIVSAMRRFLDNDFSIDKLYEVASVKSDEYYVNMALAWFWSFALIKRYEETLPIIESERLPEFVHNKAIQKARESYRISDERKQYLNTLKIK